MNTPIQGGDLPARGFDEPFGMLQACHQRLDRTLALLVRLRAHMRAHGADGEARDAARTVARYFDQAAPQHHRDEELHVFPPLLALGRGEVTGAVDRLAKEHAAMESQWARLGPLLHGIAEGGVVALSAEQEAALDAFAALYAGHVRVEEDMAYPEARAILGDAALQAMGKEMRGRRGG